MDLQFLKRRLKIKLQTRRYRFLMKNGLWKVGRRFVVLTGAKNGHLDDFSNTYIRQHGSRPRTIRKLLKSIIKNMTGLQYMYVFGGKKSLQASALYFSRTGHIKFFDVANDRVLTTTSREEWDSYSSRADMALYKYFGTPKAELVENHAGLFRQEEFLSAPPLGLLPQNEKMRALQKICRSYTSYILEYREPPQPELIMACYNEVKARISPEAQEKYSGYHDHVKDLSKRYYFVKSHLDFNVANLLFDDNIWLVDLDDAGLSLPSLYDLNNLALNEVFERRDLLILREFYFGGLHSDFQKAVSAAIVTPRPEDYRVAVFMNFFMREADIVSDRLLKGVNEKRTETHWGLLEQNIPWW